MKNAANSRVNPATEDGNLAAIKTNTDNLTAMKAQTDLLTFDSGTNPANLKVNVAAGDVGIMNAANSVINPATEETLTLIKNQTAKLTFDGNNLMISGGTGGGSVSVVGVNDATNTQVNPATDDSIVYLRRMVKLMESQATVDSANRQRITLDSLGASTLITTTVPVSGSVTATVASTTVTAISAGTTTIGDVTIGGYDRRQFMDIARSTYAMGIRSNLVFS